MNKKNYIYALLITIFCYVFLLPFVFDRANAACKESRPTSPPILLSAVSQDRSVTLIWTEAQDPVTYYLVRYGLSKQNLEFGNPNIGPRGTYSFTVNELTNGLKYYFQVMAGNGCKPGEFSNTLTAVPGGIPTTSQKLPSNLSIYKQVLGDATSSAIKKTKEKKQISSITNINTQKACAFTCQSWPLLVGETIALLLFFYLAHRYSSIKPIFSVVIPVFAYILFYRINGECTSYKFSCKYFVPINIIVYISIFIVNKYKFMNRHND